MDYKQIADKMFFEFEEREKGKIRSWNDEDGMDDISLCCMFYDYIKEMAISDIAEEIKAWNENDEPDEVECEKFRNIVLYGCDKTIKEEMSYLL